MQTTNNKHTMKKTLKTTLLAACCLVLLAGCGKQGDTTDNGSASVGNIVSNSQNGMGPDSPDCPSIYEPVCTDKNITYKNACHAEKAGETGWQPGEC